MVRWSTRLLAALACFASSAALSDDRTRRPADAETASPAVDPATLEAARRELRQVVFASAEIVGGSLFVGSGFKRALAGSIDEQGPVMLSLTGAGATGEVFEGPAGIRLLQPRLSQASALLFGYQWTGEFGVLMLAAGPEIAREQALDRFGYPRWRAPRKGVSAIAEVWTQPSPGKMAQGTVIYSSARGSIWGRLATGFAPFGGVFIGPEISAYADAGYREMRVGAHLTGLTLGAFTFRLSGGLVRARGGRSDGYVGFQTYFKI